MKTLIKVEANLQLKDLTTQHLALICNELATLRLQADLTLAPKMPHFANKPYPIGRCREIRDEMFNLLQVALQQSQKPGLSLLRDGISQGHVIKKAWGSLRDEYFQNALIFGPWYIDVANDTVNANKPRVEMLPLATSQFSAITSFAQFTKIARSYWQVDIYKNDICPALAPYMPLLCVGKNGVSWLAAANDDMLSLAVDSQFEASIAILNTLPSPPEHIKTRWANVLASSNSNPFLVNHGNPVNYCRQYQQSLHHPDIAQRDGAVIAYSSLPKSL